MITPKARSFDVSLKWWHFKGLEQSLRAWTNQRAYLRQMCTQSGVWSVSAYRKRPRNTGCCFSRAHSKLHTPIPCTRWRDFKFGLLLVEITAEHPQYTTNLAEFYIWILLKRAKVYFWSSRIFTWEKSGWLSRASRAGSTAGTYWISELWYIYINIYLKVLFFITKFWSVTMYYRKKINSIKLYLSSFSK